MPLLSPEEVLNLKLSTIPKEQLKQLAAEFSVSSKNTVSHIIEELIATTPDEEVIDEFIKNEYAKRIEQRRAIISDEDLKSELGKVNEFSWGVVQGQLDQKIQSQYVRKIVTYEKLVSSVAAQLHQDVTHYAICTWFNHWTTVLIEEHISSHDRVIPTVKPVKGVDIFFDGQPFDLKITYLPRNYDPAEALDKPLDLAIWMYEHQGAQRFGSDNRLFVILLDKADPESSWELKRDFALVFDSIDDFFDKEVVSAADEIVFTFDKRRFRALSKVLLIAK